MGRGYFTGVLIRLAAGGAGVIPEDVIDIYRDNAASRGGATAMLNWYRCAAKDLMSATDLAAPIETPTLIVWGLDDVALGEACLEGTERYVSNLRIEKLPGVSHFSPEDAPAKVDAAIQAFL